MSDQLVRISYDGHVPIHVEGFSPDCPRSREGSVHILPRSVVNVTREEATWIRDRLPRGIVTILDAPAVSSSSGMESSSPVGMGAPSPDEPVAVAEDASVARRFTAKKRDRAEDQPEERPNSDV